jgi:uncharacterized protein
VTEVRQNSLDAFLQTPEAYGLDANVSVERIDTHISAVFLAGNRAYKLKKPVDFGYLDFTGLEKRRQACIHELELNRRTAPDIYLRVVAVRQVGDGFALDAGVGPIVEWLLEMVRFDQADVLSTKASTSTLRRETIEDLARLLNGFHQSAEVRRDAGGQSRFVQILTSSAENFAPFRTSVYPPNLVEQLNRQARAELERVGPLLDARRQAGWVRHCHGDLHLDNVVLIDGAAVPFDCIEFNDDFARIDILYDLAFLLMDLCFREKNNDHLSGFANAALNAYLQASPIEEIDQLVDALRALPLFMSTRAGVRSHVNARTWENAESEARKADALSLAVSYAEFALGLLKPFKPALFAVGGLSGAGKTTVAKGLAPQLGGPLGAVHLRTDVLRKKMAGVALDSRLPSSAYSQAASDAVYAEMLNLAVIALSAGQSVICDAVFSKPQERSQIEQVAREAGLPFVGIWLEAPSRALEARVLERIKAGKDASDATVDVVRQQLSYDLGPMTWMSVESEGTKEVVLARCAEALNITAP